MNGEILPEASWTDYLINANQYQNSIIMENLDFELQTLDQERLSQINGGHNGESYTTGQAVGRGVKYAFQLIGMYLTFA